MTRNGVTVLENEIRSVISQGIANNGIAGDTPYTVIMPDPQTLPEVQRAQRIYGDILVSFRLAGSVRRVVVRTSVSL